MNHLLYILVGVTVLSLISGLSYLFAKVVKGIIEKVRAKNAVLEKVDNESENEGKVKEEIMSFKKMMALDEIPEVEQLRTNIGIIEIFIFGLLTFILLSFDDFSLLIKSIGGWIGIKVLGNYELWKGPILGRMLFYDFLQGTLISIGAGIFLGVLALLLMGNI
jgi:hypothetical protein